MISGLTRRALVAVSIAALIAVALPTNPATAQDDPIIIQWDTEGLEPPGALGAAHAAAAAADTMWVPSFGEVSQMAYSPVHEVLFVRDGLYEIRVIDVRTQQLVSTLSLARRGEEHYLNDLSVSPDGNYLFAADRVQARQAGVEEAGQGEGILHRYEIATDTWLTLPLEGDLGVRVIRPTRIEAVSDRLVLTLSTGIRQAVSFLDFDIAKNAVTKLDSLEDVLTGDFEYDPTTGSIFKADMDVGAPELREFALSEPTAAGSLSAAANGVKQGGPELVLAADGKTIFYGALQLSTDDINTVQQVYDEGFLAATDNFAVDLTGDVFFIPTGEFIGNPGWWPTAVTSAKGTGDIWLAHPNNLDILHCTTSGVFIGCPRPNLSESSCDRATPTIDMNTNGGNGLGTPNNDIIFGTPGDDVIHGAGGDDLICAGAGDDIVYGGPGNDGLIGSEGRDRLIGGEGHDNLFGGDQIDRLWGNNGHDNIYGGGGSDRIYGGPGQDYVYAGSGADRVYGGPDDDLLFGQGGQDFMWGDDGNDTIQGNFQSDRIRGGAGNDTIRGAEGRDKLYGEEGDDELFGGDNTDYLSGGPGVDMAHGQRGKDNPLVPDVSGCEAETRISC